MPTDAPASNAPLPPACAFPGATFWLKAAAAAACIAAALYFIANAGDLNTATQAGVIMELPERVGEFVGTPGEISQAERLILPDDTEFARMNYKNEQGDMINVSIVLSGSEKRSIHRPEICLPAQGWSIGSGVVEKVPLQSGRELEVMKLMISRPVEVQPGEFRRLRSIFMYWFVGKDTTTPLHYVRILKTSWDRVFHKTNHRWAYVIVSAVVGESLAPGGRTAEDTAAMLKDFIRQIVPFFQKSEMLAAGRAAESTGS